jgi:AcrR family transcriptional regulator
MSSGVIPAQQRRSRATLARLVEATLQALEKYGLAGATIPRIARAARVAPATIYRRFNDRSALYRTAPMAALERGTDTERQTVITTRLRHRSLERVVSGIVKMTMEQYQARPGLMRALVRFIETDTDEAFRARALGIVSKNVEILVQALMPFSDEIRHRDARRAATMALLTLATIVEVRALEEISLWHTLLPLADAQLEPELTGMIVAYLRHGHGKVTAITPTPRRQRRGRSVSRTSRR